MKENKKMSKLLENFIRKKKHTHRSIQVKIQRKKDVNMILKFIRQNPCGKFSKEKNSRARSF